jgi:stress response protein SCP2
LAHRRVDVQGLNEAIRAARQDRGELAGEIVYRTTEGARAFAPGDRIMFRENNRELGVKNGMLGTVERAEAGHLSVQLDNAAGAGRGRVVSVSMADYAAVDHGYATTIHKSQGATVDRAFVLASGTMDRHLTYVAMTRHRDGVTLYAGRDEFSDIGALSARLSRSQAKETTLDYAERRGFETEKPRLENARTWVERGRERLIEVWARAEQAVVGVRERFAGQRRLAENMSEQTAEQASADTLRTIFRSGAKPAPSDRLEALRTQFGQEHGVDLVKDAETQQQALRDAFAQEKPAERMPPEQLRQVMQQKDKPAAERRQGKEQDRDRSL